MRAVRRMAVAVAPVMAVCGSLAISTQSASAATGVVQAIHAQDKVVSGSAALARLRHLHISDPADARKLVTPIEGLAKKFRHSADVVAGSSADSAAQRSGRHDWVTGVREIAGGFDKLGRALREVSDGNASGAQKLLVAAEREVAAGQKLGDRGDRLLGIRQGD